MDKAAQSSESRSISPRSVWIVALSLFVLWTLLIAALILVQRGNETRAAERAATVAAEAQFEKDVLYRRWNADLGGVYARVSAGVEPNPYLTQIDDRDVRTNDGELLTMINPAYMTRQVHELGLNTDGVRGHITSLDPIRPGNAPDAWEAAALKRFDGPGDQVASVQSIGGEPNLRFMKPLVTEKSCLQCHAQQGYKLGDVRGGISVSVPMERYNVIARSNLGAASVGYGLVWLIGSVGLLVGGSSFSKRAAREQASRHRIEELLEEQRMLVREVQHRVKNNMAVMSSLLHLKTDSVADEAARQALEDVSARFRIMNILYDKLYRGANPDVVSLRDFIPEVVHSVVEATDKKQQVSVDLDIPDMELNPRAVTNLGILTAELVTNSLKHAFRDGTPGRIWITAEVHDGKLKYVVSDNGPGLPRNSEVSDSGGLGLRVVEALATQLDGTLTVGNDDGAHFTISFPV